MSLLENYIQELESYDVKLPEKDKHFTRIRSIDFVKGLAIMLIIMAHCADAWISPEWRWAYGLLFMYLDVFGPSLFIFLSAISVTFSIKKREGLIPEKVVRKGIFIRALVIMMIGVIYNLFTNPLVLDVPFYMMWWGWNILMFIGIAQIICFYAVKLPKWSRAVIGFGIVIVSDPIRMFLFAFKDGNPLLELIHFILISPAPHNPLLPYISLCFFSTIFAESIFQAMLFETDSAYYHVSNQFLIFGLILIGIGVLFGLEMITPGGLPPEEYHFISLLPVIQNQPFFEINGISRFLVRGTGPNLLYSLGMALVILGQAFYFIDLRHKDHIRKHEMVNVLMFYGRVSLSLFFFHHAWLSIYALQLNIFTFFPVIIGFIGFLGMMTYIWVKYAGGVGTFEWMISQMAGGGKKKKGKK